MTYTHIVKKKFQKSEISNPDYKTRIISNTWIYIHDVTVGNKISIIKCMNEDQKNNLNSLLLIHVCIKEELEAFKNLRNFLAHNSPLNIYLTTSSSKKERNARFKVVNKLANIKASGIKTVSSNIKLCKNYIKFK